MGIYDRDYSRPEGGGIFLGGDRSMVTNLILINIGVYLVQLLFDGTRGPGQFTGYLALDSNLFSSEIFREPWRILNLVTYGFVHSRGNLLHVLFNMYGLWLFGRDVEGRYGRREFLSIYLTTVVVAGLVWAGIENLVDPVSSGNLGNAPPSSIIGASGGVSGVLLLFVMLFPTRTLYFFGVVPVPVWVIGVLYLFFDMVGAVDRSGNVAYTAHLAGAAYGFIYFKTRLSLVSLWPRRWSLQMPSFSRKPQLRVHDPDETEDELSVEVDEILKKIQEQGQDSLTAKERRILERASRRYQQKHR